MLVVIFGTVTFFSSCHKEKIEEIDDDAEYSIIGTWKYTFDSPSDYCLITFNLDGTGKSIEFDNGKLDGDETFKYSYSNNVLTVFWDEDGYKDVIDIKWQGKNKFITSWFDQVDIWIRQ